ncbi:heavy-metal-associated domain-containing protein [Flavobacterium sp.]|uniref:heavy-metal-associated domain-containing protein n=1 Tax=Flavobacterium sp. TaxID=239 RepID=UPI003D0D2021
MIHVQNLKNSGSVKIVLGKLKQIPYVTAVEVFLEKELVEIDYRSDAVLLQVKEALRNAGYPE